MTPSPLILRQIKDTKARRSSPKLERGTLFSLPPFLENSGKQDQGGAETCPEPIPISESLPRVSMLTVLEQDLRLEKSGLQEVGTPGT